MPLPHVTSLRTQSNTWLENGSATSRIVWIQNGWRSACKKSRMQSLASLRLNLSFTSPTKCIVSSLNSVRGVRIWDQTQDLSVASTPRNELVSKPNASSKSWPHCRTSGKFEQASKLHTRFSRMSVTDVSCPEAMSWKSSTWLITWTNDVINFTICHDLTL